LCKKWLFSQTQTVKLVQQQFNAKSCRSLSSRLLPPSFPSQLSLYLSLSLSLSFSLSLSLFRLPTSIPSQLSLETQQEMECKKVHGEKEEEQKEKQ
jgi:hypothetical protein